MLLSLAKTKCQNERQYISHLCSHGEPRLDRSCNVVLMVAIHLVAARSQQLPADSLQAA
jgi:hypothetical protein